jgi:hypothetical protein
MGQKPKQPLGIMGAGNGLSLVDNAFDKVINDVANKRVSADTVKSFTLWSVLENPIRNLADYSTKPEVQRDVLFNAALSNPVGAVVGNAVMSPFLGYQAGQEARKLYEGQSVMGGNAEVDRLKSEAMKFNPREFAVNNPITTATALISPLAGVMKKGLYAGQGAKDFAKAQLEGKTFGNVADKMERMEIPDNEIKLNNKSVNKGLAGQQKIFNLSNILEHDKLFQQYPELNDYQVWFNKDINSRGSFDEGQKLITINTKDMKDTSEIKSTILHEIQHAIQEKEGFARGGNLESIFDNSKRKIIELNKEKDRLDEVLQPLLNSSKATQRLNNERIKQLIKRTQSVQNEIYDISNKNTVPVTEAHNYYNKLAGEIEARDVSARMNLTPEQRAKTAPYSSENIPVSDWIVRKDGGKAMSIDPKSLIEKQGLEYKGIQKGSKDFNIPDQIMFNNPKTNDTLMIPVNEVTPESLKAKILQNNKDWGIK